MNSFSYPSISNIRENSFDAFVIGADKIIYRKTYLINKWSEWTQSNTSTRVVPNSPINSVLLKQESHFLMFVGDNGSVYYKTINSSIWNRKFANFPKGANLVIYQASTKLIVSGINTSGFVSVAIFDGTLWSEWYILDSFRSTLYGNINIIKGGGYNEFEIFSIDIDGSLKCYKIKIRLLTLELIGVEIVSNSGVAIKLPVGCSFIAKELPHGATGNSMNIFLINPKGKLIRNRKVNNAWEGWKEWDGIKFPVGSSINALTFPEPQKNLPTILTTLCIVGVSNNGALSIISFLKKDNFESPKWEEHYLPEGSKFAPGTPVSYANGFYLLKNLDGVFYSFNTQNGDFFNLGNPILNNLWGFAELHSHIASFLAFGADETGKNGIIWGKPGLGYDTANISVDLPICDKNIHADVDYDFTAVEIKNTVMSKIHGISPHNHGRHGYPSFEDWPHALSICHQQMHVTWIRRAYEGGLRLMVASITDNQMMSKIWNWKITFDQNNSDRFPQPDHKHDYKIALISIKFIKEFAKANNTWMEVVTTPLQARNAIKNNKIAIVLGIELDYIDLVDVIDLCKYHDVRTVIPIHLANSCFGGTAVYSDLFNANNLYLHKSFLEVETRHEIEFKLSSPPTYLGLRHELAFVVPDPEKKAVEGQSGYTAEEYEKEYKCREIIDYSYEMSVRLGHINKLGLVFENVLELLSLGIMIDMAHMSEKSMNDCVELMEWFKYPFMNTHTGLRDITNTSPCNHSERSMRNSIAKKMGLTGGVLGLGTAIEPVYTTIYHDNFNYAIERSARSITVPLEECLTFTNEIYKFSIIRNLTIKITIKEHTYDTFAGSIKFYLTKCTCICSKDSQDIPLNFNKSMFTPKGDYFELSRSIVPPPFYFKELDKVEITVQNAFLREITITDSTTGIVIVNKTVVDSALHYDTYHYPFITGRFSFLPTVRSGLVFDNIRVSLRTGSDNLEEGSEVILKLYNNGSELLPEHIRLNKGSEWKKGDLRSFIILLPNPISIEELTHLYLEGVHLPPGDGGIGETWRISEIKIEVLVLGYDPLTGGWQKHGGKCGEELPEIDGGWIAGFNAAFEEMGGRGVTIGTDLNGFEKSLPFTTVPVSGDIDVHIVNRNPNYPYAISPLSENIVGDKTFTINKDGLAHFGLIPDFFQAIHNSNNIDAQANIRKVFRSAEDFILMWEKCDISARSVTESAKKDFLNRKDLSFNRIILDISTGVDDLRDDMRAFVKIALFEPVNGYYYATSKLANLSRPYELPLNRGELKNHSNHTFEIALDNVINVKNIKHLEIFTSAIAGSIVRGSDNWDLDSLHVKFINVGATQTLVQKIDKQDGTIRFKGAARYFWVYDSFPHLKKILEIDYITKAELTIISGDDGKNDEHLVRASLKLKDNASVTLVDIGGGTASDGLNIFTIMLDTPVLMSRISHLVFESYRAGDWLSHKDWDISEIKLRLFAGDGRSSTVVHRNGKPLERFEGLNPKKIEWIISSK